MLNPAKALSRRPGTVQLGELVSELLVESVKRLPTLKQMAEAIFNGIPAVRPFRAVELEKVRRAVLRPCLSQCKVLQIHLSVQRTSWDGENIPSIVLTLAFLSTTGTPADAPTEAELLRDSENWSNWPSAEEEDEVHRLVREAEGKGFCEVFEARSEVRELLGAEPILNKLGVVVKYKEGVKKARIIWALRESLVNKACDPAERVILMMRRTPPNSGRARHP